MTETSRSIQPVDANVIANGHRAEAPDHDRYRNWLEESRQADEPMGVSSVVLSGFLRVVTHPRVFKEPTPLPVALDFADAVRSAPSALELEPGRRHWEIFTRLCRAADVRGNLVPDAHLAALAIERGATWYSADRSFARFADLRWRHPLER